jgi:hypothetical protein
MKSFKGYLLTESDTSKATLGESAIVLAYNMSKGSDEQKAFDDGLVVKATQNKLIADRKKGGKLIEIGQNVVGHASFGDKGKVLQMSAASKINNYGAKDKTSKSDIHGGPNNNISIKKKGDSSEGAQLMSAQGDEMAGVFHAGMKHFESVEKIQASNYKAFNTAVDNLKNNMEANKKTKLNMPKVGIGKTEISDWYKNHSGRFEALKGLKELQKYIGEKGSEGYENRKILTRKSTKSGVKDFDELIEDHMKAELMQINALTNAAGFANWFFPELGKQSAAADSGWITSKNQPSRATFEDFITPAYLESTAPLGAAMLGRDAKVPDATKEEIKKDVADLVGVSVKMPEWKEDLEKEIGMNINLHKWIVYEAASGRYKFTGSVAKRNGDYSSSGNFQVANRILVFNNSGFDHEDSVYKFAKKNGTALLGTLDINWKGSGRSRSAVGRVASTVNSSYEYPETAISKMVNECVDAEWTTLNEEIEQIHLEYLNEGIFADIAKGIRGAGSAMMTLAKKVADKFKEAWNIFYEKVILRVVQTIRGWGKKTATGFFTMMGLEVHGRAYVKTPSW